MEFTSTEYQVVKSTLDQKPTVIPTALILALDVMLLVVAFLFISSANVWLYCVSQILLATVFFHSFTIVHECGHGNVSKHKWLNILIGHAVSPLSLLPYYPWKYIHSEHHKWAGNINRDPTMRALKMRRDIGKVHGWQRWIWKLWIPLAGMIQHTVFWAYPMVLISEGKASQKKIIHCAISVIWIFAFWLLGFVLAPSVLNIATIGPAFVVFFVVYELVNLPHHSDQPVVPREQTDRRLKYWEQHKTTRSCYYPLFLSEILFLNFNFHVEHHFFPNLPWHRLRALRKSLKNQLTPNYTETIGIGWNIENRAKNPEDVFLRERYIDDSVNCKPNREIN